MKEVSDTWKYDEYDSIEEVLEFIKSTYSAHYSDNQDTQVIDMWEAQGSLGTTARDTAQKYLVRYGRKNGYDRDDLLKAIHYIVLMMYVDNKRKKEEKVCIDDNVIQGTDGLGNKIYYTTRPFKDDLPWPWGEQ